VKDKGLRPWLPVIAGGASLVSHAGATLLVETARRSGLAEELSTRLGRWRKPLATHDPAKIVLDLAVAVALGGDAAADVAVLRAQSGVFGSVASDPTVSRLIGDWPATSTTRWRPSRRRGRWRVSGYGSAPARRPRAGRW